MDTALFDDGFFGIYIGMIAIPISYNDTSFLR